MRQRNKHHFSLNYFGASLDISPFGGSILLASVLGSSPFAAAGAVLEAGGTAAGGMAVAGAELAAGDTVVAAGGTEPAGLEVAGGIEIAPAPGAAGTLTGGVT